MGGSIPQATICSGYATTGSLSGYATTSSLSNYLTTTNASSTYAPKASPTFTGTTTAAALTVTGALSLPNSSVTNAMLATSYLTTSTASSTYATIASLSGYATTASLSGYATTASLSSYLTTSTASSTYLTISNASSTYATTSSLSSYAPKASPTFSGTTTFPGSTVVDSAGKVGIGTTSPQYTLDVNGTINSSTKTIWIAGIADINASPTAAIFRFTSATNTGGFASSSNVTSVTIPYTGYYMISYQAQGSAQGAVNGTLTTWIEKNGGGFWIPFQLGYPGVNGFTQLMSATRIFYFNANDTISGYAVTNSGGVYMSQFNMTIYKL